MTDGQTHLSKLLLFVDGSIDSLCALSASQWGPNLYEVESEFQYLIDWKNYFRLLLLLKFKNMSFKGSTHKFRNDTVQKFLNCFVTKNKDDNYEKH